MKSFGDFFKQKQVWLGLLAITVVVTILAFANFGSTMSPLPQNMPVALVMQDTGAKLPTGQEMNFGKLIQEKLTAGTTPTGDPSPVVFTVLDSEQAALDALDRQTYYGAVVLPADMTQKLLSLQSPQPQSAEVKILVNQGKNFNGAQAVGTGLEKMIAAVNVQLRDQLLTQIEQRGGSLSVTQARALATPLTATVLPVNAVGANSVGGNAPVMLTSLMWLSGMIGTVLLFLARGKVQVPGRRFGAWVAQLLTGAVYAGLAAAVALLITQGVLGMDVPDSGRLWLFLTFVCYSFFLLQTMVVNWLGFAGMPLFILVFFFGGPVLGMPMEFLPGVTQDWLMSWLPLRFAVEGLRDILYFQKDLNLTAPATTLGIIAAASAVLALLAVVKKERTKI